MSPTSVFSHAVSITAANGTAFSGDASNVTIKKTVAEGGGAMTLKIKTDQYASETSYKIFGPNNNVVQQSSSFTNSTVNEFPFAPSETGCYRVQVKDSYGDGISGGYIRLYDANNAMLFNISGTSFASEVNAMVYVGTVDINEASMENTLIFPNPATDFINIQGNSAIQQVEVFNLEGQRVAVETGNVNRISVSGLANGMYILKVTANDGVHTYKVSKR